MSDEPDVTQALPPVYSVENLPTATHGQPASWPAFRKHAVTHALRIREPFAVETSEGLLTCNDGYLAIDARGYPYPIAADEFELIYRPAEEPQPSRSVVRGGFDGPAAA